MEDFIKSAMEETSDSDKSLETLLRENRKLIEKTNILSEEIQSLKDDVKRYQDMYYQARRLLADAKSSNKKCEAEIEELKRKVRELTSTPTDKSLIDIVRSYVWALMQR